MLFRGLLATQLSGALDGLIAARNSGGAYFRNRTTPTDPNTSRQIYMRSALNAAYLNWLDLSPEQRAKWESYARTIVRTNRIGAQRHNSGWNEFVRAYTYRKYAESQLTIGLTTTLSAIDLPQPIATGCVGTLNSAENFLTFSTDADQDWMSTPEGALLLEVSGVRTAPGVIALTPYPPTRNFFKGPWQLAAYIDTAYTSTTVQATLTREPTAGERVFWRARVSTLERGLGPIVYGTAICP